MYSIRQMGLIPPMSLIPRFLVHGECTMLLLVFRAATFARGVHGSASDGGLGSGIACSPLRAEWIIGQVDLFHGPDFTLPPLRVHTKAVVTVPRPVLYALAVLFRAGFARLLVTNVPRAVDRADWVLVDSESTRRDVIELLKVPGAKVSVLYRASNPASDRSRMSRLGHAFETNTDSRNVLS